MAKDITFSTLEHRFDSGWEHKQNLMIKAIIFDIDGVLSNSLGANTKFFKNIMQAAGYKHPTKKDVASVFHMTRNEAVKVLSKTDSKKEIKRILQISDEIQYPIELLKMYPDVKKTVKHLSAFYPLAVVTSRRKKTTNAYFRFSGLKKYFRAIVSYEDTKNHKPHPDPLLLATKKLKVKPKEAVYVGDQASDIKAAKAASMKVIIYRNNLRGADYLIKSFKEIPRIVKKLK